HRAVAHDYPVVGPGPKAAAAANLPATLILFWGAYALALQLAGRAAARWTLLLTALTPLLVWISRETLLDYWLSAWVVAGLALLARSRDFTERRPALGFGVVSGLGLLTKWFYAGFLVFPVAYVAARSRIWRDPHRRIHAADAMLAGGTIAALWYVPRLASLARYFSENMRVGAAEGEPPVLSFQSLIYYLRLLEGYQL